MIRGIHSLVCINSSLWVTCIPLPYIITSLLFCVLSLILEILATAESRIYLTYVVNGGIYHVACGLSSISHVRLFPPRSVMLLGFTHFYVWAITKESILPCDRRLPNLTQVFRGGWWIINKKKGWKKNRKKADRWRYSPSVHIIPRGAISYREMEGTARGVISWGRQCALLTFV